MPPQNCVHHYIVDGIARSSLSAVEEGYNWTFDTGVGRNMTTHDVRAHLSRPSRPIAIIYGEQSQIVTPAILDGQRRDISLGTPVIGIPEAGHHVMLDQPIATAVALRSIVHLWR